MRRNVYLPDDDWRRLQRLAADASVKAGRPVSASEYLRELIAKADAKRPASK